MAGGAHLIWFDLLTTINKILTLGLHQQCCNVNLSATFELDICLTGMRCSGCTAREGLHRHGQANWWWPNGSTITWPENRSWINRGGGGAGLACRGLQYWDCSAPVECSSSRSCDPTIRRDARKLFGSSTADLERVRPLGGGVGTTTTTATSDVDRLRTHSHWLIKSRAWLDSWLAATLRCH